MMQQDLKALLRRQQDPSDVDDEVDPDRERERERIFDMRTVSVQRTCKKNKGGGLFRFQAFVVVGNGDVRVASSPPSNVTTLSCG
jgi:ribosomal protein S5